MRDAVRDQEFGEALKLQRFCDIAGVQEGEIQNRGSRMRVEGFEAAGFSTPEASRLSLV